ncbi:MAG TPA: DUF488 domain-containing protein [Candidatus Acidoferrales bacterium]|nr:DUF488 domain-containing protein [Candidatus Acidoferrales bacterium]
MKKRPSAKRPASAAPTIFTVGHSNHSIADFLALLKSHRIKRLVDVRTIPKSRHNPQFHRDALAASLRRAQLAYTPLPKLGGLRHARADSVNTGWNNSSFRGFADYMQTPEFSAALARLERLARTKQCAILCAEAVPWRCHRSLIADALAVRGYAVKHIMTPTRANLHKLTPFARVRSKRITYPPNKSTRAYARTKAAVRAARNSREDGIAPKNEPKSKPSKRSAS